jgi:hypothetical protein
MASTSSKGGRPLTSLSKDDVGDLLEALNLAKYKPAFAENEVDGKVSRAREREREIFQNNCIFHVFTASNPYYYLPLSFH